MPVLLQQILWYDLSHFIHITQRELCESEVGLIWLNVYTSLMELVLEPFSIRVELNLFMSAHNLDMITFSICCVKNMEQIQKVKKW